MRTSAEAESTDTCDHCDQGFTGHDDSHSSELCLAVTVSFISSADLDSYLPMTGTIPLHLALERTQA